MFGSTATVDVRGPTTTVSGSRVALDARADTLITFSGSTAADGTLELTGVNLTRAAASEGAHLVSTGDVSVAATDDLTVGVVVTDTSAPPATPLAFGRLGVRVDLTRTATALVSGGTGTAVLDAEGAATVSATTTGLVDSAIASDLFGSISQTSQSAATASVVDTTVDAASLTVTALSDDVLRASAKVAVNVLTGAVAAVVAGSTVTGAGDVVVSASDRSTLEATSDRTAITPGTALITIAGTRADNRLDRPVSAQVSDSTVTTTGDLVVTATTAPTLRSRVDTTIVRSSSAPVITGAAAVTGTMSVNALNGGARAAITDSTVTADDVLVRADSSGAVVDAVSQLSATSAAGGSPLSFFGAGLRSVPASP